MTERNYFRVEYPKNVRPLFMMKSDSFPVINLSEGGMLLCLKQSLKDQQPPINPGEIVGGVIQFTDKDRLTVFGRVIRLERAQLAIIFDEGVSFQKIMSEQRALISRFGTLKRPLVPAGKA